MSKALQVIEKGSLASTNFQLVEVPRPVPSEGEVVIKTVAIGLNPVDYKIALLGIYVSKFPVVLGREAAGVVDSVGPGVDSFKPGDNVYGATPNGAYAEYIVAPAAGLTRKPDDMSWQLAAGLTLGPRTAANTLQGELGAPFNAEPARAPTNGQFLLIWGGASTVGVYAIQNANHNGYRVIAVASGANLDYVKSLGAEFVVDYKSSDPVAQIRSITGDALVLAADFVGSETSNLCLKALSNTLPARLAFAGVGPTDTKPNVTAIKVLAPANGALMLPYNRKLLSNNVFKFPKIQTFSGLTSIPDALAHLSSGRVSATKLIVNVGDS